MKHAKAFLVVVLVAVVLAACGGSDDGSEDGSSEPPTTQATGDQADDGTQAPADPGTETTIGDVGDHFDTAGGTASVTIGDESWEFELVDGIPILNCDSDFFGGFFAILTNPGADMANPLDLLTVALPGGDFTDPPTVTVNLQASGGNEWIADETIYEQNADLPAGLGVTAFTIDGNTASGSALFFEQESYYQFNAGNGDLVVSDGTFTVACVSSE